MKNKRKLVLYLTAIILVVVVLIGISYAMWLRTFEQTERNLVETGCFNIAFEETGQDILIEDMVPMSNDEGMQLTPYSFKLENKCDVTAEYIVKIEVDSESTLSNNYVIFGFDSRLGRLSYQNYGNSTLNRPGVTIGDTYIIHTGYLLGGETRNHSIREWMSESTSLSSGQNKTFKSYVTIEATAKKTSNLSFSDILVAEYGGREAIEERGNPNFNENSPRVTKYAESGFKYDDATYLSDNNRAIGTGYTVDEETGYTLTGYVLNQSYSSGSIGKYTCLNGTITCRNVYQIQAVSGTSMTESKMIRTKPLAYDYSDEGLYASEDEYGTSYYYRGSLKGINNNVIFAGFQWKVVRINGDDSIRLIYNGTEADFHKQGFINGYGDYDGDSSVHGDSYDNKFNHNNDDNAYVGYMYGTPNSSTYTATHANTNDSNLKIITDVWYRRNLVGNDHEGYILDNVFCGDRSMHSGLGYQQNLTFYSAYNRLYSLHSPTMKCSQQNDRFTASDVSIGNGSLTYPVGHLTADEVVMAGGNVEELNTEYFLSQGLIYWLMTPCSYESSAGVFAACNWDYAVEKQGVESDWYFRPVINISSSVLVIGDGTKNNPYIVQ